MLKEFKGVMIVTKTLSIPQPVLDDPHETDFGVYKNVSFEMSSIQVPYFGKSYTYSIFIPEEYLPLTEQITESHCLATGFLINNKYISEIIEDWEFKGDISEIKAYNGYVEITCEYVASGLRRDFNKVRSDVYHVIDTFIKWVQKNQKLLEATK
jgi:hypothetical protein